MQQENTIVEEEKESDEDPSTYHPNDTFSDEGEIVQDTSEEEDSQDEIP